MQDDIMFFVSCSCHRELELSSRGVCSETVSDDIRGACGWRRRTVVQVSRASTRLKYSRNKDEYCDTYENKSHLEGSSTSMGPL